MVCRISCQNRPRLSYETTPSLGLITHPYRLSDHLHPLINVNFTSIFRHPLTPSSTRQNRLNPPFQAVCEAVRHGVRRRLRVFICLFPANELQRMGAIRSVRQWPAKPGPVAEGGEDLGSQSAHMPNLLDRGGYEGVV